MSVTYVMEAHENYTSDIVAEFATTWSVGTTQMYTGFSFDRVRRKIMYCANPVALGDQIGAPVSGTIGGTQIGYVDGSYPDTNFTGGSGSGGTADMTVSGGAVTVVTPNGTGSDYQVGDVLSGRPSGGFGSGFTYTLTAVNAGATNTTGHTLWSGQTAITNGSNYDGTLFKNHSVMEKDLATDTGTRYDVYSGSNVVPSGGGGGQPTAGSITNAGSGYPVNTTYYYVPLTGGTGYGMHATLTVSGNVVTVVDGPFGGHGYLVGDVLGVNNQYLDGAGSGFQYTINAVTTGSDGTWRRVCASDSVLVEDYCSLNLPRFVDPRTGDLWEHHETDPPTTCEIYLFRRSDGFKQVISPLQPIPGGGIHMQPLALTSNYLWLINQQNSGTLPSYLVGTPRTIQAAETSVDYLLPYPWYTWPYNDWTATVPPYWASRTCVDFSNNIYILSWNYSNSAVTRTYTLKVFNEPASATPYNAATVGGGFTDITPWASTTGPNTGLPANGTVNNWLEEVQVTKTCLKYLGDASGNLAAITKIFCVDLQQTWNSTNQAHTHFDVTYIPVGGGSFDYHASWIAGYLDADLNTATLGTASWALIDMLEVDTDLDVQSYDFTSTGVDYTKRWFFLILSPVSGGVWTPPSGGFNDPTNRVCLVQVQFTPGSMPAFAQTIWDTGWNDAYSDFGSAIGNPNVLTATVVQSLGSTSISYLDNGVYDNTSSS